MNIVERGLFKVSDELVNQDKSETPGGSSNGTTPAAPQQMLKSIHRVGLFGEGLQLRGDRDVQLVVLYSLPPTLKLVDRVANELRAHFEVLIFLNIYLFSHFIT